MPGNLLHLYLSALVACLTSLLFGYSVGHVGGIIVLPNFLRHFSLDLLSPTEIAHSQARIVTSWILGCMFGVPLGQKVCSKFGRRPCMSFAAGMYVVGTLLQLTDFEKSVEHKLDAFYLGRFVNGIGVGVGTLVSPLYISEISPASERGMLLASYQVLLQLGALAGFWSAYATHQYLEGDLQWQIPVMLQLIPGFLLFVGASFILPEAPRYLAENGLTARALFNLAWIRGLETDSEEVICEMEAINTAVAVEARQGKVSFFKEMSKKGVRNRLGLGILMMVAQNMAGLNAVNYVNAPTIFKSSGFTSMNSLLFLTGLFGAVKLVFSILFTFWLVRLFGNRAWLKVGSGVAAVSMFGLAYIVHDLGESKNVTDGLTLIGVAAVLLVYAFTAAFTISLGPLSWSFCAEVFPPRIKATCCMITTTTQWIFQFVVAYITPLLLAKIGWATYLMYAVFCVIIYIWVELFVPETKGVEDMDELFGVPKLVVVEDIVSERSRLLA